MATTLSYYKTCGCVHFLDLVGTYSKVVDVLYRNAERGNDPGRKVQASAKELEALKRALDLERSQNLKDNFATAQLIRGAERGQHERSSLTKFMEPLLLGNGKTFFLAFVRDAFEDVASTRETMEVAQNAAEITAACVRVGFVSRKQVSNTFLPLHIQTHRIKLFQRQSQYLQKTGFDTIADAKTYLRRRSSRKAALAKAHDARSIQLTMRGF